MFYLQEKFSRFGKVAGVELKKKVDDAGQPIKTFAYIDLETTDKDLQKCN